MAAPSANQFGNDNVIRLAYGLDFVIRTGNQLEDSGRLSCLVRRESGDENVRQFRRNPGDSVALRAASDVDSMKGLTGNFSVSTQVNVSISGALDAALSQPVSHSERRAHGFTCLQAHTKSAQSLAGFQ